MTFFKHRQETPGRHFNEAAHPRYFKIKTMDIKTLAQCITGLWAMLV